MIIEEEKLSLTKSSSFKQVDYTFKANSVAFKILVKNLYSNVTRAIVRELSTNALDSHIAAGRKDIPFHVHLPNHFEPWFSVTDTGIGMSEEFVLEEYTAFFASNKRDSNEAVGCFGLGAKVPFAYTDNFTVLIRYNGVETTYNPVINEEGMPILIKLTAAPTKERNGCQVKFAVKSHDFYKFIDEAKEVYHWFDVPPIISGAVVTLPVEDYMYKNSNYAVLKRYSNDSYVVMGNVAYPLQVQDAHNLPSDVYQFLNWGIRLYMKLGDVQLTPSREALNYDPKTVSNIKNAVISSCADFKNYMYDSIKDAKTLWEARCKFVDLISSFVIYNISDKVMWNGKEITPASIIPVSMLCTYYWRSYGSKYRESLATTITANSDINVWHNDLGLKGIRGLKKYIQAKNISKVYVFEQKSCTDLEFQKFLEDSGLDEIIQKTSSLDDEYFKVNRQTAVKKSEKSLLYRFDLSKSKSYRKNGEDYWVGEEVDMKFGGIYIPISRFYWVKSPPGKDEITEHPKDKLVNLYRDIVLLDPDFKLYGIIPSNMGKLAKFSNWIKLEDYLDSLVNKPEYKSLKKLAKHTWSYDSGLAGVLENMRKLNFTKKSYMGNFVKILQDTADNMHHQTLGPLRNILMYRKIMTPDDYGILNRAKDKIFNKYPLMNHINCSTYSTIPANDLSEYIEFIENKYHKHITS